MKKIILFLALTFLFNLNVSAASTCSSEEQIELNQKAANIKVNYEILEEVKENFDGLLVNYTTKVSIYNITKEFYVVVTNNINDNKQIFSFSDTTDGVVSFINDDISKVVNYTVEIYTTNETGCMNERYKILYITTPRYNNYYSRAICEEAEDFDYCKEFVVLPELEEQKFIEKINQYLNKDKNPITEEEKNEEKQPTLLEEYKWYIVGGVVVVISLIAIISISKNRKKQRDLGI